MFFFFLLTDALKEKYLPHNTFVNSATNITSPGYPRLSGTGEGQVWFNPLLHEFFFT